ncbi:hypothetical protein AUC69_06225 [Methyloceanibacter superfactus]|uniref:PAS domain-containing protein n=1 Tax=Methyloceanibacter superfactus TaxID=1774969 RepID=A0A1E3W7S5_9HYPH|nr:hypothetical protein [Methyloceanibacter superfactus]ODS01562.1 hypothetical protein AUC69_06225 [Methyloceanibacter superfactus]
MADLRPRRRIEDGDREALEHIARALEGRVLLGPGAISPGSDKSPAPDLAADEHANHAPTNGRAEAKPMGSPLMLPPESLRLLLEAMPAAIGLLRDNALIYVNSAFAYAFGYHSPSELSEAGGSTPFFPAVRRSSVATKTAGAPVKSMR